MFNYKYFFICFRIEVETLDSFINISLMENFAINDVNDLKSSVIRVIKCYYRKIILRNFVQKNVFKIYVTTRPFS